MDVKQLPYGNDAKQLYHKLYYQNNKEHIKELVKERYNDKKDIINEKIVCPFCQRTIIKRMYKKHLNTKIHWKGKKELPQNPQEASGTLRNSQKARPLSSFDRKDGIITFQ